MSLTGVARSIFQQALADCGIERAFAEKVKAPDDSDSTTLLFGEHAIDFGKVKHLRIVSAGKASAGMLSAVLKRLPISNQCDVSGVIIGPDPTPAPNFQEFRAGHPFPNQASFDGAQAALEMLRTLPADATDGNTLCLFLISGGASAMMELPLDPTITLEETVAFHSALVHCGASIGEINCVRKHFSAVKGGRLAKAAGNFMCLSILLSDVPPGNTETIASGPTLPDTTTVTECREVLAQYRLIEQFPASVQRFFLSPEMPETVKPGELTARTWTILSTDDLANAARKCAETFAFYTVVDNTCDDWDYRAAADYLLERLQALSKEHRRVCLLSVGEVIVRPSDDPDHGVAIVSGNGGRNQHFALHMATLLADGEMRAAVLSAGSDGIDGHSEAAGAVVDREMLLDGGNPRGTLREKAEEALQEFHSSTFLETMHATITTGPTGNNLRDLRILLWEAPE